MPLINMFVLHTHKDNALSLETVGFYGIDPEASLEEFFRLKFSSLILRKMQINMSFDPSEIHSNGNF